MGMSRCYSLMKCLLIILNIIFLCVGGGACALAAWALCDGRGGEAASGRAALCALAAWGGALALGALLALAGALRGSAALLAGALALLALAGAAEAAAACWGAAHRPQLALALRDALLHTVRHEYGRVHARSQLLDVLQHELQCCGADGPRDWQQSGWARALGERGPGEQFPAEQAAVLDLSVGAAGGYYWAPASCCSTQCGAGLRVASSSGGGGALHAAGCAPRVLSALGGLARGPLALGGTLLVLHALSLPLTLALWLRAQPAQHYKA